MHTNRLRQYRYSVLTSFLFVLSLFNTSSAQDKTILQGFYWDVTPGGVWYDSLTHYAPFFGKMGIDAVWFPPPSKGATGGLDVGYTPYDYYDLGEFNSYGGNSTSETGSAIPTRYGTRVMLDRAIQALKVEGIKAYADVVLNHRSGGVLEPNQYKQYFTDSGGSLYGVNDSTYTAFPLTYGSGRIAWPVGEGNEFFFPNGAVNPGNTGDFYSDAQFGYFQMYTNSFGYDVALHDGAGNNLPMGDSLSVWANWLIDEVGFDGFRVDFVKGIHPEFLKRWADFGSNRGKFVVGELYDGSIDRLKDWLNRHAGTESPIAVFDFNLRFGYKEWSDVGQAYDIRSLQGRGLVQAGGVAWERIVNFVENHDFDRNNFENRPSADGHSPIINFKPLMYAHMMALPGTATIWYKDLFWYGLRDDIALLTKLRSRFFSGEYEILTARGDTFWPGNATNDPREVMVIQRSGDSDSTGAIIAINKSNQFDISVWVTANSKWSGKKLYDITGNVKDTLEVFGDNRVQVRTKANAYAVFVPIEYQLEFNKEIALTEWMPVRNDLLVGEIINPQFEISSTSFFNSDTILVDIRLQKPKSELVVTDTIPVLKAYDSVLRTIPGLKLDEVGDYELQAWIPALQSDTIRLAFSVADTLGAPAFRMDGQFNETAYALLLQRKTTVTGFGADNVVEAVYAGFDNDTLYIGIEGKFKVGAGDGIGFVLDTNTLTGLPAGTAIGKTEGATGFLNPADSKNANTLYDMEVDFGMSYLSAATGTLDASVVNFTLPDSGGVRMEPMQPNGLSVVEGPTIPAALPINSFRYSVDFTIGEKKGIEIALAKSALNIENEQDFLFRFFTFIVSSTAYYSNVMIPGEWLGTKDAFGNPGFNINFSVAQGGPFHSDYYNLNGERVVDASTQEFTENQKQVRLHPVYPNPFNPTTTVRFDVANAGHVRVSVWNILGQEVEVLFNGRTAKGSYSMQWNAAGRASGVYFVQLQTQEGFQIQKMTLVK